MHCGLRVWVPPVVRGIVEPRRTFDRCPRGEDSLFGQLIFQLPVKIVLWNSEKSFTPPVGQHGTILERLAAQMHVREEAGYFRVYIERESGIEAEVRLAGRDHEVAVRDRGCESALRC